MRLIGWTLGIVLVLALIVTGVTYFWLRGSLPDTEGDIAVSGLDAPAEITRDANGIVYIRAESANAAYFALGYAHAQDRLWQMEAMRRLAAGRLAEIGGERLVYQDRMMRTLDLYARAEASLPLLDREIRDALDAYTNGVNAWLRGRDGALPPEFALANVRPDVWRPADSLVWGRLMAWRLASGWRGEVLRARLGAHLGPERADRLFLPYPPDAPVTIPYDDLARGPGAETGTAAAPPADPRTAEILAALIEALPPGPLTPTASNAWAVSGARTATGRPVMANDPHLRFRAPNLWYLARIEAPGLSVTGATAPGVPFHVLGHNGRIAWGMTTTGADTTDLVLEKLVPGESGNYLSPDGARPFVTREEVIHVRDGAPVTFTVRETRNGPVFSDLAEDLATDLTGEIPESTVVSLRATLLEQDDRSAEALYRFARARNWADFTRALAYFQSPVQNLIYADTDGNIGLSVAGRVPIRAHDPDAPVPGDSADHDWRGYIAPDDLPRTFNPDNGTIVNANNRVVGPAYPHRIASDWEHPYRAMRIEDVLSAGTSHDAEASRRLQMDAVSLAARDILPILVRATARRPGNESRLNQLAAWDGTVTRDQGEPLLFNAWLDMLQTRLFADELGTLYGGYDRIKPRLIANVIEHDTVWCDDVTTEERETCGEVLASTLAAAEATLTERLGEFALWRWDDVHVARFRNLVLDWIPLIGRLTRITVPTDGDDFTVNRGTTNSSRGRGGFEHVHGATFRAVYDLSNLDRSLFAMPGGQSGNPLSPHYRDLARAWSNGAYFRIPARPREPAGTLRLLPRDTATP